jgi:chorismate synthase
MSTFGTAIPVSFFGESHGPAIGLTIHQLPAGIPIDLARIDAELTKRRPKNNLSTARQEQDRLQWISGIKDGVTTGAPVTILIENADTRSKDYKPEELRPSHADYAANVKYQGFHDYRGGGHFSGRLTAIVTLLGAISQSILEAKGIYTVSHLRSIANIQDDSLVDHVLTPSQIVALQQHDFPVVDGGVQAPMEAAILQAKAEGDSVGGVVETAVYNLPVGIGEPFFDSMESILSHLIFSIPAVKGVSFGRGFDITSMRGSVANDPFTVVDQHIRTTSNNSGGIQGGLTNGMPLVLQVAIKPTSSISLPQQSVNQTTKETISMHVEGRHDPAIVHRAVHVVNAMTAYGVLEMICQSEGRQWIR